jgi:hypothetical protein
VSVPGTRASEVTGVGTRAANDRDSRRHRCPRTFSLSTRGLALTIASESALQLTFCILCFSPQDRHHPSADCHFLPTTSSGVGAVSCPACFNCDPHRTKLHWQCIIILSAASRPSTRRDFLDTKSSVGASDPSPNRRDTYTHPPRW